MKKLLATTLCILLLSINNLWSQGCAMCTSTASNLGEDSANGLNAGIIYLAMIPLAFLGITAYLWWKKTSHK